MVEKLPVMDSLSYIRDRLMPEFGLIPLDNPGRTHGQMFTVGTIDGKQFLLIVGTEQRRPKQTRIITEKIVNPPNIAGVRFSKEDAGSGRVNQQKTSLGFESRLRNGNQSSFYVENLNALKELIHWYAIAKPKATQSSGVVQQIIELFRMLFV